MWRPATFKLRYFPGDKINIDALARELIERALVIEYGEGLAYIPKFAQHQHVNPREAQSSLPVPDASARVTDAQVGREGKEGEGREGVEATSPRSRGSRLPPDWKPSDSLKAWAYKERSDLDLPVTVERFRDYWLAIPGSKGLKLDWDGTFRNWVRVERPGSKPKEIDFEALTKRLEEQERHAGV